MPKYPNIGQMRSTVTLQREAKHDDVDNPYTEENEGTSTESGWIDICTVKAYVRPLKGGTEKFFASQLEIRNLFEVMIRKPRGIRIEANNRIVQTITYDGETYDRVLQILRVIDREDKHRFYDMVCEELGSKDDNQS